MRFLDTNVLVYTQADGEPRKQKIAQEIVAHALEVNHDACISTQVIQEFCAVMRRKTKRTTEEINDLLDCFVDLWACDNTFDLARHALTVAEECQLSYYDALIVSAAEKLGCHEIVSEDLNPGQCYRGMVVVNPFAK